MVMLLDLQLKPTSLVLMEKEALVVLIQSVQRNIMILFLVMDLAEVRG